MSKVARELDLTYEIQQIQHCLTQRGGVCHGLKVPTLCSQFETPECLVDYPYPPTPGTIGLSAEKQALIKQEVAEDAIERREERADELGGFYLHIRPDWRFWMGVSLAGVGLYLYRRKRG